MSLVLRDMCREHLEKFGLGMLHARVNSNKNLELVGECGQPFCSISGIRFSTKNPSVREMNICSRLFEGFLEKNIEQIEKVAKLKKKAKNITLPERMYPKYNKKDTEVGAYMYDGGELCIRKNNRIETVYKSYNDRCAGLADVVKMSNDKEFLEATKEYFSILKKLDSVKNEAFEESRILMSCDI